MTDRNINIPKVGHIIITGPTQIGKTIVMDRIEKALKKEFGAIVYSDDLDLERKGNDYDTLQAFEKRMVKETTWILKEQ